MGLSLGKRSTGISVAATTFALAAASACADEGGVSFWAPGQSGSFSAVPTTPGWSVPVVYYHASADAGASKNSSSEEI
jgi:hypothetical protein